MGVNEFPILKNRLIQQYYTKNLVTKGLVTHQGIEP